MTTNRIYRTNQYEVSNRTVVTEVREINGQDCIACRDSVFYPEGGGQPSDIGTAALSNVLFNVTGVSDDSLDSDVWHHTDAPAGTFSAGDEVELTIDWDARFRNMQRHCGEHMLSGTFHTLFGGVNRGFHMGDDYITIDIDLDGRMLTDEEIDLAERTVNDAIWADLPVEVQYFPDYETSLSMPVRKQVPHEGEVSVVTVGNLPEPYDCIACCGTHPSSSGQVGLLAVYKHEPNKGMNRIYFDCGAAAMEKLSGDSALLNEIASRNSCSAAALMHKLDVDAENTASLKAQISRMSAYIKSAETAAICDAFTDRCLVYSLDIIPVDELLKLGFDVMSRTATDAADMAEDNNGRILVLLHEETRTALLYSAGSFRCGAFIKANASQFGGRGGGRDDNARAVFQSIADMKAFAESVQAQA